MKEGEEEGREGERERNGKEEEGRGNGKIMEHSHLKFLVIFRGQSALLEVSFISGFSVLKGHLWHHPHLHNGVRRSLKGDAKLKQ